MQVKLSIFSSALLCFSTANAAERAVEAINYDAGLGIGYLRENGDLPEEKGHTISAMADGRVNLPIGDYLGVSAEAQYQTSKSKYDYYDIDDSSLTGSTRVFYRQPSLGRVSIGYARSKAHFSAESGNYKLTNTSYTYAHLGAIEAYLPSWTFSVDTERTYYSKFGAPSRFDATFAHANWYITANVRAHVAAGFEDAADGYMAEVEFQPAFARNLVSFLAGYRQAPDGQAVLLVARVYFNSRLDLLTRDRHYR